MKVTVDLDRNDLIDLIERYVPGYLGEETDEYEENKGFNRYGASVEELLAFLLEMLDDTLPE